MVSNPILQKFRYILVYLIFWLINSLLYFLLINFGLNVKSDVAIIDALVSNFLLAGLGISYWYPAKFIPFEKSNIPKIIITYIIGGIISSTLWLFAVYNLITKTFTSSNDYSFFFNESIAWRFLIGFLFYYLITTFYYVIIYYTGFQERIVNESQMKNLVAQAELKSLKFQINPHFIFNSLNS
ncbi:MAG: histidine kinase, partial [Ignavibacteriaceae bacterium]